MAAPVVPPLAAPPAQAPIQPIFIGNITLPSGVKKGVFVTLLDEDGNEMNLPAGFPLDQERLADCKRIFQKMIAEAANSYAINPLSASEEGFECSGHGPQPYQGQHRENWVQFIDTLIDRRGELPAVVARMRAAQHQRTRGRAAVRPSSSQTRGLSITRRRRSFSSPHSTLAARRSYSP